MTDSPSGSDFSAAFAAIEAAPTVEALLALIQLDHYVGERLPDVRHELLIRRQTWVDMASLYQSLRLMSGCGLPLPMANPAFLLRRLEVEMAEEVVTALAWHRRKASLITSEEFHAILAGTVMGRIAVQDQG